MSKKNLYYQAKQLAETLGIQPPRYVGSSIVSLQQFITTNTANLPFLGEVDRMTFRDLRYVRNRPFGQIELEIKPNETIENNENEQLRNYTKLKKLLRRYLLPDTDYKVVYYHYTGIDAPYSKFENKIKYAITDLDTPITIRSNSTNKQFIHLGKIFGDLTFHAGEYNGVMRKLNYEEAFPDTFGRTDGSQNLHRPRGLDLPNGNIIVRFIPIVTENPPLENQRDGLDMNCVCAIIKSHVDKLKDGKQKRAKLNNIKKINKQYFDSGINDEGYQMLANKTQYNLVVKDKIGKVWREFKPKAKGRYPTIVLVAHNNHNTEETRLDSPYDSDDEEDESEEFDSFIIDKDDRTLKDMDNRNNQVSKWFKTNEEVINRANEYEREGNAGTPIISKGNLVAYITEEEIWKTEFYDHENYPECFTSGGVGKAKFVKQMIEQQLEQFKYGINDSDPFYDLLMDADRSGFYSRTCGSDSKNTKYDQNKSYKSFAKSGLFNGFPILEAIFKIDKPFSLLADWQSADYEDANCDCDGNCEFCINDRSRDWSYLVNPCYSDDQDIELNNYLDILHAHTIKEVELTITGTLYDMYDDVPLQENNFKHGLLYVEWDTLTKEKLNNKIYYEGNGWYPVEIVKEYYTKYNIDPFIKSYAYAKETFKVDFQNFTNEQFRTFLGKCISKSFDEVWRTSDYLEFMRARYILNDRVISFKFDGEFYQIIYASDKKPWNMPVVSAYVKAHQKYNLFQQYNKLIDNGIVPVAVCVDGIEVKENCDHLFNMGKNNGQWKHEKIYIGDGVLPSVIERAPTYPRGEIEFSRDLILSKYMHVAGAGGNGKTNYIIELAKAYPSIMYVAPTNDAVKTLLDRAKELGVDINAKTYHKVFGIGCRDVFRREKYSKFVMDECSMVSAETLNTILSKLPTQSMILSGDFYQLTPPSGTPIYDNWTKKKSPDYEKFQIKKLTKNYRQKEDSKFFDLCNSLRDGLTKSKALEILDVLNTRVTDKPVANDSINDIHVCGINAQVDEVNKNYKLEVGCKVICNTNCKSKEGYNTPNGSIGIITSITPFQINFGDLDSKTSIYTFSKSNGRFTPAYALTVHKSQGKTIKRNVIINPSRLFAKNHLYVALTRAVKFSNVYLTKKMTYNVFCKTVKVVV